MLTRKQLDLLDFINKRTLRDGVPPSFDEMRDALDLRSKSGIHRLITALEERGFIRRLAHRARAIEIVRLPESLGGTGRGTGGGLGAATGGRTGGKTGGGFAPRVIDGDTPDGGAEAAPRARPDGAMEVTGGAVELPVM